MSMLDWNNYRQQLTVQIGEIAKISPNTIGLSDAERRGPAPICLGQRPVN